MWRRTRWILLALLVLAIGFVANGLFPLAYYLPHKKPVLILPFDPRYDPAGALMPMGEKINHPDAPDGHPGIDFGFDGLADKVPYIAAMDGTVRSVRIYANNEKSSPDKTPISKKKADVIIVNGPYQTVYAEMDGDSLPAGIRVGARIRQGDLVGYGNLMTGREPGTFREMIHWEFGSTSPVIDRFCPLTYFTPESRLRIEAIWAQTDTPEMKARYPKICNGGYDGKAEK
jgi:murein DD-endopeptidase MepM/ murein hydrolase activator NlpD